MSEAQSLFTILRQSADPAAAAAIERHVNEAPDSELSRINVLDFAARYELDEERAVAAFLHGARRKVAIEIEPRFANRADL